MKKNGMRALFRPVELTQGECWKTILAFSFPIVISYLLQQVYTISDAAIVGQTLSAQEVAGVNDTSSLIIFLQFAFGVSAGFCVVTSCNVGAHNPAGVRRSMTTQIALSAVLTVLLTALALVLLDPMLAWINVTPESPEVYRAAYTYCAIIFAGIGCISPSFNISPFSSVAVEGASTLTSGELLNDFAINPMAKPRHSTAVTASNIIAVLLFLLVLIIRFFLRKFIFLVKNYDLLKSKP